MRKPTVCLTLALATLLAGCAVGPDYKQPVITTPAAFGARDLVATEAAPFALAWWQGFNDPLLTELVTAALTDNQGIKAADARLKEARAARREQLFGFLPIPTATANGQSLRQSRGGAPPGVPVTREYDLYDAGFDASWELDLFGRARRANQSASAAAQAVEAARQDVRLSVAAELARNYFELRGAQNQLAVAERNASNQQHALQLVQARLEAGRGTVLDTARAEAQVQTTLASVPPLQAAVTRAMHRIEVLAGKTPGTLVERLGVAAAMPTLPTGIALGEPADLLRRRPDIRVAERQLAASSARIGIAVADLFPRVSLNGRVGLSALSFNALGDAGNDTSSFGPSLSWAFLDYGRIRQRIKAAGARNEAQLADYQQTVLLALEDTENALSNYGREQQRLQHLAQAARASVQAADLATQRFEGGVSDFLTALDAYRSALEAEDLLAASQTRAATSLIAVYKALGGGWETAAAQ